jgi:hypothetical protein
MAHSRAFIRELRTSSLPFTSLALERFGFVARTSFRDGIGRTTERFEGARR